MIRSKEERAFRGVSHIVLFFCAMLALLPFWLLMASSITSETEVSANGYSFIPSEISFDAYRYILNAWATVGRCYGVTILVTLIGTVLCVLITTFMAYSITQKDIPGVKVIYILILISMLFNGGIVPSYYVWTNIIHIKNTIWALILPNLMMNAFNIILVKNYIQTNIPQELVEAIELDGGNQFQILRHLIFPLSKPILATIGLLAGVSYWNDWTNGLYYIDDSRLYSIQQYLNKLNDNISFLAQNVSQMGNVVVQLPTNTARMAMAVIAILPILIVYIFFQKFFTKGITMGSIKG